MPLTDLGEYIVQLRGERPAHIITYRRCICAVTMWENFSHEKLGIPYTEDIPTLTDTARKVLRDVFLYADVGISGVKFGVAETGTICVVSNEGNARMVTTLPRVHIALMGIERLVQILMTLRSCFPCLPVRRQLKNSASILNSFTRRFLVRSVISSFSIMDAHDCFIRLLEEFALLHPLQGVHECLSCVP